MDAWIGSAAIFIGLCGCFFGYLIYLLIAPSRGPLILAGLIYGHLVGHALVPASHPGLALVTSLSPALVLAVLAYPPWGLGVIVIGAALGFMMLSSLAIALNASLGAVILMGVLGATVVGFQFYRFDYLFVMLANSFNGAIQAVYGLGLFFPALALGGGRANWLAVVAMMGLGGVSFAVHYCIFIRLANLFDLDPEEVAF